MTSLMIVAHPDDEVIFGGLELSKKEEWYVICLTNRSNIIRKKEFIRTMKSLNVPKYEIWDFEDGYELSFDEQQVLTKLYQILEKVRFDKIVSHNIDGEYGHMQHKALSKIVRNLEFENLYEFCLTRRSLTGFLKKLFFARHYVSQRKVVFSAEIRPYLWRGTIRKVF